MEYRTIFFPILKEAEGRTDCFYCALRRRTALIKLAFATGFNAIAFGHHLDDLIETLLMNVIYHGNISTMPPRVGFFNGALKVIRPLCRVLEEQTRRYAANQTFVEPSYRCPGSQLSTRRETKEFIAKVEKLVPAVKQNLFGFMEACRTSRST